MVGVDNHRVFAETLEPMLTTVELPHFEMGYWAVAKLVSIIEGRSMGQRLMASDHRSPAADRRADSGEDPLHADRKGLGE